MSWKNEIRLSDLPLESRLEVTCRRCSAMRYESVDVLIFATSPQYTVAEVEAQLKCLKRGCGGPVRIAKNHGGKMEGFVGGMA